VQGRQIQDCIGIASKAINMLSKKVQEGNVSYKVDIHKSFDTLSWKFLLLVLTRFGFHPSFVGWISTILRFIMLSIRINGSLVGLFPCSRGVRQGDPLSPLLFCLAEEVLCRGLSKLVNDKRFSIWLVRKVFSLSPMFCMLMTFWFSVGRKISLLEISVLFLKHMVLSRVNILTILRVVFSPWIILQDFSPKFNVFFLVAMVVCL